MGKKESSFREFIRRIDYKEYNHMLAENEINTLHSFAKSEIENYDLNNIIDESENQDFILCSIETIFEEIFSIKERGRKTIYQKGVNWLNKDFSDKSNGDEHYKFLNKLNDIGFNIPINTLKKQYKNGKIKDKILITYREEKMEKIEGISIVYMPDRDKIAQLFLGSIGESMNSKKIIEYHFGAENKDLVDNLSKDNKFMQVTDDKINQLINRANADYSDIKKYFNDTQELFESKKQALEFALLYNYNDFILNGEFRPYDLYIYFEKNDNHNNDFISLVMCGIKEKKIIDDTIICIFKDLNKAREILGIITEKEQIIIQNAKDNTETYVNWHTIYSKQAQHYESFMLFVESYITHFCRVRKIDYHLIQARIKNFESFYNKIFIEHNRLAVRNNLSNDEIKIKNIYYNGIHHPRKDWKEVFKTMNDIAGIRIICYLESFVSLLGENKVSEDENSAQRLLGSMIIKKLDKDNVYLKSKNNKFFFIIENNKKEEHQQQQQAMDEYMKELLDSKDYNSTVDSYVKAKPRDHYRGFHLTIEYDKTKNTDAMLFGNFNLSDDETPLQCEVQIRTVISHGFTEIEHERFYKNHKEYDNNQNDKKLAEHAKELRDIDVHISNTFNVSE